MKQFFELLTSPGNGVYTVHTAKERKESLWNELYNTIEPAAVEESWKKDFLAKDKLLLGVCSDTGGGILRGANWGPLFVRQALYKKLSKEKISELGDIRCIPHLLHDKYLNEETIKECQRALYAKECDLPVSPLSITQKVIEDIHLNYPNKKIFAIGGDHSVSYPLVKAWLQSQKKKNKRSALIHFDAHTDLLDKRLGIDICFGSWTHHIIEDLHSSEDLYQIGIRSTGKERSHWENTFNIHQYWAQETQDIGPENLAKKIIDDCKNKGIEDIYISFDIDALDAKYVSKTGTPEPQGLLPHHVIPMIKMFGEQLNIDAADVVEVAPFIQAGDSDMTVELASDLLELFIELS